MLVIIVVGGYRQSLYLDVEQLHIVKGSCRCCHFVRRRIMLYHHLTLCQVSEIQPVDRQRRHSVLPICQRLSQHRPLNGSGGTFQGHVSDWTGETPLSQHVAESVLKHSLGVISRFEPLLIAVARIHIAPRCAAVIPRMWNGGWKKLAR